MADGVRVCSVCGCEFPQGRGRPRLVCRAVACIAEKKRAYYEANRDEIAEKKRAYYEANRDEIAEKKRAYYEANRDEIAEKKRAYYEANRDEIAEKKRAYYEAMFDRIGDLADGAMARADWVEVERAVDAVLAGDTIVGLHRDDRIAAAVELLRRGRRSGALHRLRLGTMLSPLLRWWDALNERGAA